MILSQGLGPCVHHKVNEASGLHPYRESCKGDLDVGADKVLLVAAKHVLEVGHDGRVHPRQPVSSVDSHKELGALSLRSDANWNQQVPGSFIQMLTIERLVNIVPVIFFIKLKFSHVEVMMGEQQM